MKATAVRATLSALHPADPCTLPPLPLPVALRIRTAELCLRLGHTDDASRQLEALPRRAARHPWAMRTQLTIVSALTFA